MALVIKRVSRAQREANWAEHAKARALPAPATVPANMDTVLDLGDTMYRTFRGRAYGVPPVPWRLGARLLQLRFQAVQASNGGTLTAESLTPFYDTLGQLADLIWSHIRPTGKVRRMLKRLGLLRNPLTDATEAEIVALTDFLLTRRMASGVGVPAPRHPAPQ